MIIDHDKCTDGDWLFVMFILLCCSNTDGIGPLSNTSSPTHDAYASIAACSCRKSDPDVAQSHQMMH